MINPRLNRLSLLRDRALRHRNRFAKVKGGKRRYLYWHHVASRAWDKMHTLILIGSFNALHDHVANAQETALRGGPVIGNALKTVLS